MIDKTSELAVQALLYIALRSSRQAIPAHVLARRLGVSPTYLAKITRMLTKADILRSHKGAKGGVTLARDPADISMLEIVETCQGVTERPYCREVQDLETACGYHRAMVDLRREFRRTLERWNLADMLSRPAATASALSGSSCAMANVVALGGQGRTG
jgi:Rrf2 family protein